MKLLQIPTARIEERIKEEMEANPALDEGAEEEQEQTGFEEPEEENTQDAEGTPDEVFEMEDYIADYFEEDPVTYRVQIDNSAREQKNETPVVLMDTFHDYLEQQLGMLDLPDERMIQVALQIVGSIDDDGYLRRQPIAIIDDLLFSQNIATTEEEVDTLLAQIQRFDPPGVGARDLRECLLIQLNLKRERDVQAGIEVSPSQELAYQILEFYFDEFSKKHYAKLQKYLEVDEDALRDAIDEILKLNPKPASAYSSSGGIEFNYVVPDFIITNRDGELDLTINTKNVPDLRINAQYVDLLRDYNERKKQKQTTAQDKQAIVFIKQKIDSAKWFIDALRQRMQTLYRTMYAIMQFQYDYFLSGDERKIRPMILKDIAEITGLDISTVSRVANSKFVQTEFGTKKLKDFFSESVTKLSGEEVSTLEVKNTLSEIITAENKRKPV